MGKQSQKKGRSGELELCRKLRALGYNVRPGKAASFGTSPDVEGLPGVHVEVKRAERLNLLSAMKQAERDAPRFNGGYPTVFHRRSRSPWLVTMRLEDWAELYRKGVFDSGKAETLQKSKKTV